MKGSKQQFWLRPAFLAVLLIICNACCTSAFSNSPSLVHYSGARIFVGKMKTEARIAKRSKRASTRHSTSRLESLPVSAIGTSVGSFYRTFPLLAGFITCSFKAAIADRLAQWHDVCTTKFSIRRNLAMVLYSGIVLGLSCEIMYNRFFPMMFGAEKTLTSVVKMTLFDGFVNAPLIWLPPAYLVQALIYKYSIRSAMKKYVKDIRENGLLTKYWSLWIPVSFINFLIIPSHFRIAFVAGVSFFWMIILSVVANNDQDPESCPVEPEPSLLNPRALD